MLKKIYLNGLWDFCPIYDKNCSLAVPENPEYAEEKIIVPSSWRYRREDGFNAYDDFKPLNQNGYPEEWNNAQTGLYHREFNIDEEMLERRVFLCLDGIAQMAAVYVNNTHVANWDEMYLTGRIEITDYISVGKNDIKIVCTSFEQIKIDSGVTKSTGLVGSWYGYVCRGIWNDIYLDFEGYTCISDITVITSVQNHELTINLDITNSTVSKSRLGLVAEVINGDEVVKCFKMPKFTVKPGATKQITFNEKWDDAILWDTDNPHLYTLVARVYEGEELVCSKIQRFGFREITVKGPDFYLNGIRINLRGDSWHFQGAEQMTKQYALNWYKMAHNNGVNYIRLHAEPHPEYYLDAADEAGMLIVDETAIYGSGKSMYAGNEHYLERCKAHVKRLVKRDKNHPSVILWSLENEMRWVDGRDIFKLHIPEMMKSITEIDPTRKIILEGDNRLLPYSDTQVDTYHYNIDGTFEQWKREHPLVIGERGGLWYTCPQNASAYVGLSCYSNVYDTFRGFAAKEKYFIEDARRKGVSGVSVFNFAYYFARSMPNEAIPLNWDSFEGPGVKPKKITKYSLTINNGLMPDYPISIPNPTMEYMGSVFKPVTIIEREYNISFYDGEAISRSFDVYNDTRRHHSCRIEYNFTVNGEAIEEGVEQFIQAPAISHVWNVNIPALKVKNETTVTLNAVLHHEDDVVHTYSKEYKLYPTIIKILPVDASQKVLFYGSDSTYSIIKKLLPNSSKTNTLDDATIYSPDILILGDNLPEDAAGYQIILEDYVSKGGIIICLEQNRFALGDLHLYSCPFFSAHTSNADHMVLKGISDSDLMFWAPTVTEEKPEPIITSAFVKPTVGDIKFILECSTGDYADGGDLWSPLVEYGFKEGKMIFNQLDLIKNYNDVPTACILLRNIISYAVEQLHISRGKTAVVATSKTKEFLSACALDYREISFSNTYRNNVIITDCESFNERDIDNIRLYVKNGGNLFIMPFEEKHCDLLTALTGTQITSENIPTYHLQNLGGKVTENISVVDLYRYEKVPMSPRQVFNTVIANNTVSADKGAALAQSITGTPWHDYYARGCADEYAIIPLISINEENKQPEKTYLWEIPMGNGKIILSQLTNEKDNEKDIRVYSRMLANLGCEIIGNVFKYTKTDIDYAVDYFMTLPCPQYKDYKAALSYYTDKEYSLNNLGEGLYGWMRKIEKNMADGTITVPGSQGERLFLTCFADYSGEEDLTECFADFTANSDATLWINGEPIEKGASFPMCRGINRIVIDAKAEPEQDFSVRVIFKDINSQPVSHLAYRLTLDEVNPK